MIGDSICQGTGSSSNAYMMNYVVGGKLYRDFGDSGNAWSPANYGVGGSTVANCLAYVGHVAELDTVKQGHVFKYPYIVIVTGRNDCTNLLLPEFSRLYRLLVRTAVQAGIDVICMTEPPKLNMTTGAVEDVEYPPFTNEIRKIATQEGVSLVDTHKEFLYRMNQLKEDIRSYSSDGVHPNDAGYSVMGDMLYQWIIGEPIPTSEIVSRFESKFLNKYVTNYFVPTTVSNASIASLASVTTATTIRKEQDGNSGIIEILDGGYVDFSADFTKIEYVLPTIVNTSGAGTLEVYCPTSLKLKDGMSGILASAVHEFTHVVKAPAD